MTAQPGTPSRFGPILSTPEWGGRATRAEINLDAIAGNANAAGRFVHPAELMAVVKADAYGHGAAEVARAALEGGASWLGVYAVSEGMRLRQSGITAPILVFGPFQTAEAVQ